MGSIEILLAFSLGWVLAQGAKLVIAIIARKGKISLLELLKIVMKSGGMPSSHTACFTATALTIGLRNGFHSDLFALAVAVTVVIVYDATNVRYAVGQQGKTMNKMIESSNSKLIKPLKVVEGHTVPQAIIGFIVGVIATYLAQWMMNWLVF